MLAVIVIAALTPNIGAATTAQVNSQYGSGGGFSGTLEYALIGVLVAAIVAAIVGLLIFQRRKNRGSGGVAAWEQPAGGPPGTGPADQQMGGTRGMAPIAPAGAGMSGAAAPVYDESTPPAETSPEWVEPEAPATIGAAAGGATVMDESEPDIDRLMKELDQISDDILKKSPPKKGSPPEPSPDASNAESDS
jgi:hypothetical protein